MPFALIAKRQAGRTEPVTIVHNLLGCGVCAAPFLAYAVLIRRLNGCIDVGNGCGIGLWDKQRSAVLGLTALLGCARCNEIDIGKPNLAG